jgi:hypothetical protein
MIRRWAGGFSVVVALAPGAWRCLIDQAATAIPRAILGPPQAAKRRAADGFATQEGRFRARSGGTSRACGARMLPTIAVRANRMLYTGG